MVLFQMVVKLKRQAVRIPTSLSMVLFQMVVKQLQYFECFKGGLSMVLFQMVVKQLVPFARKIVCLSIQGYISQHKMFSRCH